MTLANILVLGLVGVLGVLGGCQSAPSHVSKHETVEEHPIDGMSRNISESQAGAVRGNQTLSPPPIRRDFDR